MLKTGRHFRLSDEIKLIVGRDKTENDQIRSLSQAGHMLLMPVSFKGPSALLAGPAGDEAVRTSANIMASYSRDCVFPVTVAVTPGGGEPEERIVEQLPIDLDKLRI
jgi:hypothetical protein